MLDLKHISKTSSLFNWRKMHYMWQRVQCIPLYKILDPLMNKYTTQLEGPASHFNHIMIPEQVNQLWKVKSLCNALNIYSNKKSIHHSSHIHILYVPIQSDSHMHGECNASPISSIPYPHHFWERLTEQKWSFSYDGLYAFWYLG